MNVTNEEFEKCLIDTMTWCLARLDPNDLTLSLRSSELSPRLVHDRETPTEEERDPLRDEVWFRFLMGAGETSWEEVLETLTINRRNFIQKEPHRFDKPNDLTAGKLLIFEDDISELDGQSGQATKGFFNACDVAPWDTWVTFLSKSDTRLSAVLISWVPPTLIPIVEKGLEANVSEALWLTDTITDIAQIEKLRNEYMKDKRAVPKPKNIHPTPPLSD